MDGVTVGIIAAGVVVGLLLVIFIMRKRRIKRLEAESKQFTHDVLSHRLRLLNDKVRQVLFASLESIHKSADGANLADTLTATVLQEVFPAPSSPTASVQVVNIADVRARLEQSPTLLHHCKVHVEKGLKAVQIILQDKQIGNIFRGPHQDSREASSGADSVQEVVGDLEEGRPEVSSIYCCCCCIFEATEKDVLRNCQLLYFYSMAHQMCCGCPYDSSKNRDEEDDAEMDSVVVRPSHEDRANSGPAVGLILDIAHVRVAKMLNTGNCIARQIVEVTSHAKKRLKVSAAGASSLEHPSTLRAVVDVASAPTMYEKDETATILSSMFLWRPVGAHATEGGPALSLDLAKLVRSSSSRKTAVAGGTRRDDDAADITEEPRRMWVNPIQDRYFFSAGGLRDDLMTYFVNLRRTLLLTANTDKQTMGMYDAVRVFDVATKMWMLSATKSVVSAVATEWESRVLQQARKIVQDGRREILSSSSVGFDDAGNPEDAAEDEKSVSAAGDANRCDTPVQSSPDSGFMFPSADELMASVTQKWLEDLHDSFVDCIPVPQSKKGLCCRRCVPSYTSVAARLPDTDAAVLKMLQARMRTAAMRLILTEEQKQQATAQAVPIRERLVDLLFPTPQVAAEVPDEFSPREYDRENQPTPPPPPPASEPPQHPEPPPRHAAPEDVVIDVANENTNADDDADPSAAARDGMSERSAIIQDGLRRAVDEITAFIEEAMEKIEIELAERILNSSTVSSAAGSSASPQQLKSYLKSVKKQTAKRLLLASRHISLMVDSAVSSRALCTAFQAGRHSSEAFKTRLIRFHGQLVDFKANLQQAAVVTSHETCAAACSLELTITGFVLGHAAVYSFIPMREVVESFNFHAARFPELPQGLSLD